MQNLKLHDICIVHENFSVCEIVQLYSIVNCYEYLICSYVINLLLLTKPYIKGQYWMITTIPQCDNYFLVGIIQSE